MCGVEQFWWCGGLGREVGGYCWGVLGMVSRLQNSCMYSSISLLICSLSYHTHQMYNVYST